MLEREKKGELENKGKRNSKYFNVKYRIKKKCLLAVIKQLKQNMVAKR